MNRNASFNAVARMIIKLSDRQQQTLVNNEKKLRAFLDSLAVEEDDGVYFTHLNDKDVPEHLQDTTAKWRKLASEYGYSGPVAWRVREGFTLKQHSPKAGKVYEDFKYLQDWKLQNDEPTKSAIVFWIPKLLADSKSKTADQQRSLMAETRTRHGLPEHHLSSFGSAALLIGLMLAHFKRTGERTPLNCEWARTDTLREDGRRLVVGCFDEGGPDCGGWSWGDGYGGDSLGVFALGVELD